MQGISITTQRAQIQIRTERAQVQIDRPRPRMNIRTRRARMHVEHRSPQFRISKTPMVVHNGASALLRGAYESHAPGIQQATRGGRFATSQGQGGGHSDGSLQEMKEFTSEQVQKAASAPSSRPSVVQQMRQQIEWDMGYRDVTWEPFEMVIEWDMDVRPSIKVKPHSIEIKLSRYPSVKVNINAEYYERLDKRKYDKRI